MPAMTRSQVAQEESKSNMIEARLAEMEGTIRKLTKKTGTLHQENAAFGGPIRSWWGEVNPTATNMLICDVTRRALRWTKRGARCTLSYRNRVISTRK